MLFPESIYGVFTASAFTTLATARMRILSGSTVNGNGSKTRETVIERSGTQSLVLATVVLLVAPSRARVSHDAGGWTSGPKWEQKSPKDWQKFVSRGAEHLRRRARGGGGGWLRPILNQLCSPLLGLKS